jgi:peptidoglycan/xylan/chitin deacetylase (PgdA/CDA1 family)
MRALPRVVAAIACAFGLHHVFRRINRNRLLIVCYHGVTDRPPPPRSPSWHHIDRHEFRRQIEYLARHYRILPLDTALDVSVGARADSVACITFDDGYRNNRTVAFPILEELDVPATIYLTTGMIGSDGLLWTVRLAASVLNTSSARLDLSGFGRETLTLRDDASRRAAAMALTGWLKTLGPNRRDPILAEIWRQLGDGPRGALAAFDWMDWDDVRHLESTGLVHFGAHTVNHEILSTLDDARLRTEVCDSTMTIRESVATPSATFAYPNGRAEDFNDECSRALSQAGVLAAVTTIDGLNGEDADRYCLKRVVVGRDTDFNEFRLAASGALDFWRRTARLLRIS